MTTDTVVTPAPKVRRWNWGWSIALVYTVFALGTIAWAVFSFSQKVELVSNDYYAQEIAYDGHAEQITNAQQLATPVNAHYSAETQRYTLHFPIAVSKGTVTLYRPSNSSNDRNFPLNVDAAQEMSFSTQDLLKGRWQVQVQWQSGDKSYFNQFKLDL